MPTRRFRCTNYGNCADAAAGKTLEIEPGQPEVCPGCGRSDMLMAIKSKPVWPWLAAAGLLVLLAGLFFVIPKHKPSASPLAGPVPPAETAISSCRINPVSKDVATKAFFFVKQGMGYARSNDLNDALHEFDSVIATDPNFLAAHADRAAAEIPLRKFREAEADLAAEKRLTDCLSETGVSNEQLASLNYFDESVHPGGGDGAAALADSMQGKIKEDKTLTHFNLACLYSEEEQTDQAITELKSAVHAGFSDKKKLMTDPSLENARHSKDFHSVEALMP